MILRIPVNQNSKRCGRTTLDVNEQWSSARGADAGREARPDARRRRPEVGPRCLRGAMGSGGSGAMSPGQEFVDLRGGMACGGGLDGARHHAGGGHANRPRYAATATIRMADVSAGKRMMTPSASISTASRTIGEASRCEPSRPSSISTNLIGNTRTDAGLRVRAELDTGTYPKGVTATDAQMKALSLHRDEFRGDWNCELRPR